MGSCANLLIYTLDILNYIDVSCMHIWMNTYSTLPKSLHSQSVWDLELRCCLWCSQVSFVLRCHLHEQRQYKAFAKMLLQQGCNEILRPDMLTALYNTYLWSQVIWRTAAVGDTIYTNQLLGLLIFNAWEFSKFLRISDARVLSLGLMLAMIKYFWKQNTIFTATWTSLRLGWSCFHFLLSL